MRVFSGIQPSGEIHIGNYLGVIKQWLNLQSEHDCMFCIVDLHALTVPYNPKEMQERILEKAIAYLAAGIDPKKSIIFVQSHVKEHTELNWLLSTVTPFGNLKRMTQFKEKSKKHPQNINAGLFNYPVLMAADILLYQTELVPVGKDQIQHVELTREIAERFNKKFGKTFQVPKALLLKTGAKIMSLTNPEKKMSKSDPKESYISLFDSPDAIKEKIKKAQTDSGKEIKYNVSEKPGISNLLAIYSLFSEKTIRETEKEFENKNYQFFKEKLAELLIEKLKPFREKKKEFLKDKGILEKLLKEGAERARERAQQSMRIIKKRMGLSV